jgi:hypothetical protein
MTDAPRVVPLTRSTNPVAPIPSPRDRPTWVCATVVSLAALAGCADDNPDVEVEFAALTTTPGNPLDPPRPPLRPAAIDMLSAHEAKVPVSRFFRETRAIGAPGVGHTFQVRTNSCSGDTGLLVRIADPANQVAPATVYNDDAPAGGTDGTGDSVAKGSLVTITQVGVRHYEVVAFSQRRSTAHCTLQWRQDGGAWNTWTTDHFGGALVEVGALASDAFIEVSTPNNGNTGIALDDTELVVFNIATSTVAPGQTYVGIADRLYNDNQSNVDKDPRAAISASNAPTTWIVTRNFALIGKRDRSATSTAGVETVVALLRGPFNQQLPELSMPWQGGLSSSITLTPGRYAMWVKASTNSAPGSLRVYDNPTADPVFDAHACQIGVPSNDPTRYHRGQLNSTGFDLEVEVQGSAPGFWYKVLLDNGQTSRRVPRGAFGQEIEQQRFVVMFDVRAAGTYRLNATIRGGDIVFGAAGVVRNPASTELKVASANMLYDDPGINKQGEVREYRNAANLLATRGSIVPSNLQIEELGDQAPYQWWADAVFLTEVYYGRWLSDFRTEANTRGPLEWDYQYHENERSGGNRLGYGGMLVASNLWPTTDRTSMRFSPQALANSDCSHDFDFNWRQVGCEIFDEDAFRRKWIIPARLEMARFDGSGDRPIAIFGVHFHAQGSNGQEDRLAEIKSTAGRIEELLEIDATAFNREGDASPYADGNRIVILGDFNIYSHNCGEHYWMLRALRERFGFAIDVALADEDSVGYAFGMHNFGEGVQGNYLPERWVSAANWAYDADTSPAKWQLQPWNWFPWYGRTFRSATQSPGAGTDRHDVIMLVGRGWSQDDALRSYTVMQDNAHSSPFSVRDDSGAVLGGIEMYQSESGEGGVPNTEGNYRPNYGIGGFSTTPGAPALMTDHRPIAARLRLFTAGTSDDR